jgi:hypothetical protein
MPMPTPTPTPPTAAHDVGITDAEIEQILAEAEESDLKSPSVRT